MTILSELYDGDKFTYREDCRQLRRTVRIPHPLKGVKYADGIYLKWQHAEAPTPKEDS
jgi:hypothetical protein